MTTSENATHPDETRLYMPRIFNKTTRARFMSDRRRRYLASLGGVATGQQLALIMRCARAEWDLLRIDRRTDDGEELSERWVRTRLGLEGRLQGGLRELGLRKTTTKPAALTFADVVAEIERNKQAQPSAAA